VAERKRNPWFVLIEKMLFRVAFAGFMVVEFAVFVLLLWALSKIIPEPNYFLLGTLIVLILSGPFLIGACSYLVFQRMTQVEYVLSESERWLAERHETDPRRIERRKRLRRWAVWVPTVSVLLFCLFLDQTWPPVSHLLHPGYGRLGTYRVSMPLDWTVIFSEPDPEGRRSRSYVYANRWKGMLTSGINEFIGRKPSMTSSSLGCYRSLSDEFDTFSSAGEQDHLVATRRFSLGNVAVTCEEFVSRDPKAANESHTISCVTAEHDFYCTLDGGDKNEGAEFYDMVQQIRRTK